MARRLLLTGLPGAGKTTVVLRALARLRGARSARGFTTREVRAGRTRTGFGIRLLDGREGTLADVSIRGPLHVGRYGVTLAFLEEVALPDLEEGLRGNALLIIDEIGKMECLSEPFREFVGRAFRSEGPILATIPARGLPFAEALRRLPGVEVRRVTRENRDGLVGEVIAFFAPAPP